MQTHPTPAPTPAPTEVAAIAEIVTFRLVPGADPDAFARAAQALTPFLRESGAVLGRSLSRDADGLWTDHVLWTSLDQAREAAARMMQRPEAQPFLAMIAPEGVSMRHAAIHLQME